MPIFCELDRLQLMTLYIYIHCFTTLIGQNSSMEQGKMKNRGFHETAFRLPSVLSTESARRELSSRWYNQSEVLLHSWQGPSDLEVLKSISIFDR